MYCIRHNQKLVFTAETKMFSIEDFSSKYHIYLEKSLVEKFIFCAVCYRKFRHI